MELKLVRINKEDKYTIGKLYINGVYFCDTLEDKDRDYNKNGVFDNGEFKVYAETAIPYGEYRIIMSYSPTFKRVLPEILNVKHFTGIRIHRGNTADNSKGCILLGENKKKGAVINSTKYEVKLCEILNKIQKDNEEIYIKIV